MTTPASAAALLVLTTGDDPGIGAELRATWVAYQRHFMSEDGRTIDIRGGQITTSEGQAYAMVRALWVDDRATFDRVWRWTVDNLQGGDHGQLPAWKWGQQADTWGVIDPQPASDADQFLAWALLGASDRWGEPRYRRAALRLLGRIWEEETEVVAGDRLVLPGPWARAKSVVRINPSYLLPFAWRDFAQADDAHDWMGLLDAGYEVLDKCRGSTGLPKDWCYLDPATGAVLPAVDPAHDNFGFEAFRVAWTLAAEAKWNKEKRARVLLRPFVSLLDRAADPVDLPAVLSPDGESVVSWEYPGMYGAILPAWSYRRPTAAQNAYDTKILPIRADHGWGDPTDYYGQNWIWLGMALWQSMGRPT